MYSYWYPMYRIEEPEKEMEDLCTDDVMNECSCLKVGDRAPDFTLEGVVCGRRESRTLSDYRGKWLVLFFYSSDFTFA